MDTYLLCIAWHISDFVVSSHCYRQLLDCKEEDIYYCFPGFTRAFLAELYLVLSLAIVPDLNLQRLSYQQ